MYYEITPVDGYIVIENASDNDAVLSLTKLRATNVYNVVDDDCGILPAIAEEAVAVMTTFAMRMRPSVPETPEEQPEVSEDIPSQDDSGSQENPEPDNKNEGSFSFIKNIANFFKKIIEFLKTIFNTLSGGAY